MAQEYAEYNIRVNSVHPGAVSTPGIEADDIKDVVQAYVEQIPMKRIGDPNPAQLAWQAGLAACLGSGVITLLGSLVAEKIRRATPRAALLSPTVESSRARRPASVTSRRCEAGSAT